MRQHPTSVRKANRKKSLPTKQPVRGRKPTAPPEALKRLSEDGGGFLSLLLKRIDWVNLESLQQRKHAAGRPVLHLGRGPLLAAIVFHYTVTWAGTLGEHLYWLLGNKMSESS